MICKSMKRPGRTLWRNKKLLFNNYRPKQPSVIIPLFAGHTQISYILYKLSSTQLCSSTHGFCLMFWLFFLSVSLPISPCAFLNSLCSLINRRVFLVYLNKNQTSIAMTQPEKTSQRVFFLWSSSMLFLMLREREKKERKGGWNPKLPTSASKQRQMHLHCRFVDRTKSNFTIMHSESTIRNQSILMMTVIKWPRNKAFSIHPSFVIDRIETKRNETKWIRPFHRASIIF